MTTVAALQLVLLSIVCFIRLCSVDGRHCKSFFRFAGVWKVCSVLCFVCLPCFVLVCFVLPCLALPLFCFSFSFASFCFAGRLMDRFGSAWFSGGIFPLKCSYCKLAWTNVGSVAVAMFEFSTFLSIILSISFHDSYLLFLVTLYACILLLFVC